MAGIAAAVTVTFVIWYGRCDGTRHRVVAASSWRALAANSSIPGLAAWPRRLSFLDNNLSLFSKF